MQLITIDGPAASGKSSVSRELARRLGWSWVSTGVFYRGIAWASAQLGVDPLDSPKLTELIESSRWAVQLTAQETEFWWDQKNVTSQIQGEQVGAIASKVSSVPEVRAKLLKAQRDCSSTNPKGLIAEGRDCGTVVFPDAPLKFFLTARAEERARRRLNQDSQSEPTTMEIVLDHQKIRDAQDASRKVAPLAAADGATVIDSSRLTFEEVVAELERRAKAVFPK